LVGGKLYSSDVSGSLEVYDGGQAFRSTLEPFATAQVWQSGVARDTQIYENAIAFVSLGGTTVGTVLSGGKEWLKRGGRSSGTLVLSGGQEIVQGGGAVASNAIIQTGGVELVFAGGHVYGTTLSGGMLKVASTGKLSGGLTINGGRAVIMGEVQAGQTVGFTGSGVLQLNNVSAFGAAISGFTNSKERIDLNGFAFSGSPTASWTQSGTSGTLTVTDGSEAANLTLIGTYDATNFILGDDAHGGTFVTVSQTGAATRFAQAAAGTAGGRAMAMVPAYRGGPVEASPLVGAVASGR